MARISDIKIYPVRYPVTGHFKFLEGPKGSPPGRPSVLAKITGDDGTCGWGQSVPLPKWSYETLESVASTLRLYIGPQLVGLDIFDLGSLHRVMDSVIAGSFSTGMPIAKAGIDIALHDLAARASSQSLAQRWGCSSERAITLSWTVNPKNLDEVDSLIQDGRQLGYRHFNVKVAPDTQFDIALCKRVRELAPDSFLWADANGGYDLATALRVAPILADLGVDVLEQPLRANQISGYRALKRQGALPIILDEGVVSPEDLIEFIRLDMLDGVAMKPARCGGLVSARRQIEILREAGLMVLASGLTDPDVSLAASLALFGASEYRLPAALNGPQFLSFSVLKEPLLPVNGLFPVPEGPGLGVDVDEEMVERISTEC